MNFIKLILIVAFTMFASFSVKAQLTTGTVDFDVDTGGVTIEDTVDSCVADTMEMLGMCPLVPRSVWRLIKAFSLNMAAPKAYTTLVHTRGSTRTYSVRTENLSVRTEACERSNMSTTRRI